MMHYKSRIFLSLILFLGFCPLLSRAEPLSDEPVPDWLQKASRSVAPTYDKKVPAVVLHDEQVVTVGPDGVMTISSFEAIRLLRREGRNYAGAYAPYLQSSSKVRSIRAWLIKGDGTPKFYGREKVVDAVSDPDDIYDEYRIKSIDASNDADSGMVFGYETVVEERPLFTQDSWGFQGRLPTLMSRYTLNLPSGWQATSVTFNRPEIKPTVSGSSYTWEEQNLAPIPPEPDGLSVRNLAPRIVINYFPANADARVYDTWSDVSKWYTDLSSSSLKVDDVVAGKARDLTVNAKSEFERIKAIGQFVQSIRYISLQIDVAHGGAQRPRPSDLVLQRGFGDCKDKANLMRAMLKAMKIESYLVLIYSGDPTYVRSEWPSPRQFNHCIIAIRVGPDTTGPAVITSEKLGRLLIFDPTDEFTQLGDLPDHEQGSYALISAGQDGHLSKMPIMPAETNRMERTADVVLDPNGSVTGKIHQGSFGQSAAMERGRFSMLTATEYKTYFEKWLAARLNAGSLTKAVELPTKSDGTFDVDLEFTAPGYAQVMQGRLMMFKPAMVGRLDQFSPVEGSRITPILIDSSAYSETIRVKLPEGFVVDEMPAGAKLDTTYGKYLSKYEIKDGVLIFSRSMETNRSIVPPSEYENVKKFFGIVRGSEEAPVVLVRK